MLTLAQIKVAIRHQLDALDTTEDAYLTALEAAAVAYVTRATGRGFGAENAEAEFVVLGDGSSTVWLPQLASAVTAVTERAYLGDAGTEIETGAADGWALRLDPGATHGAELVRAGGAVWASGYEYVVSATTGYGAGTEPADIRQAVTMLVAHWYEFRIPVALGAVAPEIAFTLRELLAPWKRWVC